MGAARGDGNAGPPECANDAASGRGGVCPVTSDGGLVAEQTWPEADPGLLIADSVTIAVQIMGKLRGTIAVPPDSDADAVIAAAEAVPHVAQGLAGKRIVRRIHVPNRIVNFVVAG